MMFSKVSLEIATSSQLPPQFLRRMTTSRQCLSTTESTSTREASGQSTHGSEVSPVSVLSTIWSQADLLPTMLSQEKMVLSGQVS